jgi:glucosamine 6-phosphate synthetase-like amidotransferase/phosphosugar isomerase protein
MCGIFGYLNYGNTLSEAQAAEIYAAFANVCIVRGSHAAGIAYVAAGKLQIKKDRSDLVKAGFTYPLHANVLNAHCRLSIQNNYFCNENNHPFCGQTLDGTKYAVEHNGILMNLRSLRQQFHLPTTNINTDSYFIVQLLDTKQKLNNQALKEVCETLQGSFVFTVLDDKGNFYLCRGDVPVYVIHFKKWKLYVYISTRDLFEQAVSLTFLRDSYKTSNLESSKSNVNLVPVHKGHILRIAPDGEVTRELFIFQDNKAICHNWYLHEITETDELKEQLANLNNE